MDSVEPLLEAFPRAALYRELGSSGRQLVKESGFDEGGFPYSERHLQCAWFDPAIRPAALRSSDGEEAIVEDPGRWNLEAGPDFLDAALVIGPGRRHLRGDVEIHVRPADWLGHGHKSDPAYARVIAHVSYLPGPLPRAQLPTGAVQIVLKDELESNPLFSFESIDVAAYPYAAVGGRIPPCAGILSSWSPQERAGLLDGAGEERLRIKASRMAASITERGTEQVLYEETMAALGYKHNEAPFRLVARRVPLSELRAAAEGEVARAYALLLGVSGLLPAVTSPRWDGETRGFVRGLWDFWWKQQHEWQHALLPTDTWRQSGLRPQNRPARRLAAAAALFGGGDELIPQLSALETSSAKEWVRQAGEILQQKTTLDYWRHRLSFGGKVQSSETRLIGPGRLSAIVSNVIIPCLAATGVRVTPLLDQLPPEQDNALTRQTAFALFGRDHNPALYRSGLRQQGLLQIFHDFCLNNRTACRDCALPPALTAASTAKTVSSD